MRTGSCAASWLACTAAFACFVACSTGGGDAPSGSASSAATGSGGHHHPDAGSHDASSDGSTPSGPCSGTSVFCDDYTNPALAGAYHTANGTWTRQTGVYVGTDSVQWERARAVLAGDYGDFDVTIDAKSLGDSGFGLVYAASDDTHGYAVIVHPAQFQGVYLKQLVPGSPDVEIKNVPLPSNEAGVPLVLRVQRSGTMVTVWLGGVQQFTADDGGAGAHGHLGLLVSTTDQTTNSGADFTLLRLDSASPAADGGTPPPPAGTTYYVSPSGSDANSGTSQSSPWQTLARVNSARLGAGDSVLFQGGQSFSGCLVFSTATNIQSSSASNPITVGSYGSGVATIDSTTACAGSNNGANGPRLPLVRIDGEAAALNGFIMKDLTLAANGTPTQYGVLVESGGGNVSSHITLQNLTVKGFNVVGTQDSSSEIRILGYPLFGTAANGPLDHISVLNCTLMGENGVASPDDSGIGGYGYGLNITNVTYSGNTVYNLGGRSGVAETGAGIGIDGVDGATVSHNVIHDIGANANSCGGMSGIEAYTANNATVSYNEVYRVVPTTYTGGCDWDGIDLDGGTTNSVVEYNYVHDNRGEGLLAWMGQANLGAWGPNVYRYNISENDGQSGSSWDGNIGLALEGGSPHVEIYDNTVINSGGGASNPQNAAFIIGPSDPTTMLTGTIANNIFYTTTNFYGTSKVIETNTFNPTGLTFTNNDYFGASGILFDWAGAQYSSLSAWQSASGQDSNAMSVNPGFSSTGFDGACGGASSSCPAGTMLPSSSPLMGRGANLTGIGAQDYYGNAVAAPPNVGAY